MKHPTDKYIPPEFTSPDKRACYSNIIYEVIAGSHAIGMATEESDLDVKGVYIPPPNLLLGFKSLDVLEANNREENIEYCYYSISKYLHLAMNSNPTLVEMLFSPEDLIINTSQWGNILRENRHLFLSRIKTSNAYIGYAKEQLKRMNLRHQWLGEEPPPVPNPDDYYTIKTIAGEKRRVFLQADYKSDLNRRKQYEKWLKEYNKLRATKAKELGFEPKNACHLVRLLDTGIEVLSTGNITLPRPNTDFLLAVRNGELTYDGIINYADESIRNLRQLEKESPLPELPDKDKISSLLIEITTGSLYDEWEIWG